MRPFAHVPDFGRAEVSVDGRVRLGPGHLDLLEAPPAPLGHDPRLPGGHHRVCIELPDERRPEVGEEEEGVARLGGHGAVLEIHSNISTLPLT